MKFTLALAATAALVPALPAQAQPQPAPLAAPAPPALPTPLAAPTPPAASGAPAAPSPAAIGHAREIVDIILPPARYQELADKLTQMVMGHLRGALLGQYDDPGIRQIVDAYLAKVPGRLRPVNERHIPLIVEAMVQSYAREFSADELKQISDFGKTPAGAHYLAKSLALQADPEVARANQAYFSEAAQTTQAGVPDLRLDIINYLAKHPEVARRLQAQQQQQQQQQQPPQQQRRPRR